MDPREFHKLATQLTATDNPAELRTAISRAYYAALNVSAEVLSPLIRLTKGPAAHGEIQKVLQNCGDQSVVAAGRNLENIHSRRIDADYRMTNAACENRMTVQATVAEAGAIIETLDRAFSAPDALAIKDKIQKYWHEILRMPG